MPDPSLESVEDDTSPDERQARMPRRSVRNAERFDLRRPNPLFFLS